MEVEGPWESVVEVALLAFFFLGGGVVWEVGLSLQGTSTSKARQRASPRVEAGTKKRDRGGQPRALC